ncbi:response regulator transcription factor [Mediterraneibacter glycyrrhizinilyticus]|uniref:response regulator transcription factor n=1 Tax=Mediterraneibacter glycyrrhizinilyticus TaxID=342942 RepID=UPI00195FC76F|nr:response regulator transcription factor [Mediterraneibacter glycyrrhizinilyticus]MBM6749922.1 response regulator transcription factor [Mediterraneibacter glycyrrhizinilyticus]
MRIGIIEDDRLLCQALEIALQEAGYGTASAHTKKEAFSLFDGKEALLLIDIGLPDGDGVRLYQQLCREGKALHGNPREDRIPAIFLTARDEERDMLAAFDVGAEDYVVKPFSMKVLLKRIEVVLRRKSEGSILVCRDLELDPERKQVLLCGEEITLTAKEYRLLEYFMRNQGQVLTVDSLLQAVWGLDGEFVSENTVSVTIRRLRKKIEPDMSRPVYIRNVFGLGYRMGE